MEEGKWRSSIGRADGIVQGDVERIGHMVSALGSPPWWGHKPDCWQHHNGRPVDSWLYDISVPLVLGRPILLPCVPRA